MFYKKKQTFPNIIENLPSKTGKTSAIEPKMVKAENLVGQEEPGNNASKRLLQMDDMKF